MIDFIIFKIDINVLEFWFLRILFLAIGLVYIIYILLQIRQIGIMNNTLKTKASVPIAVVSLIHLFLVVIVIIVLELLLFFQS